MAAGQKKTHNSDLVEQLVNLLQAQRGQGRSDWDILSRGLGGYRQPITTTNQAVWRGLREFVLPMIMQGVKSWKDNYDLRGDINDNRDRILELLKAGTPLSEGDQSLLDSYQKNYPKEYEKIFGALRGGQAAPQDAQTPVSPGVSSAMQDYVNQQRQDKTGMGLFDYPDYQSAEAAMTDGSAMGGAFSGTNYDDAWAQDTQRIMGNLTGGNDDVLKKLLGAWR